MLKRFFKRSEPVAAMVHPRVAEHAVLVSIGNHGKTTNLTFVRNGELHEVECYLPWGVTAESLKKDLLE